MRILVCGGRAFDGRDQMHAALDAMAEIVRIDAVIHGDAIGADRFAGEWARLRGIEEIPFPADWAAHGRTYGEQRWSPLSQIDAGNVSGLGLAWYADLDTNLTQEATPLAIDGKLYVSTAWSKAFAYDAVTGALLWQYDPEVPRETLAKTWDAFNRGMAAWGDKLYLATLDGRLIALDRATGKPVWSVATVDRAKNYTVTGAPRAVNGMVVIGNEGALLAGGLAASAMAVLLQRAGLPGVLPLALVAGMVAGAAVIAIVGLLRELRGVNETISSLSSTSFEIASYVLPMLSRRPINASISPVPTREMISAYSTRA